MFTPTEEQSLVVERAKSSTDNILLSALAGAAKTSTLVLIAEALPDTQILCLAFNKRIADEMQERLPSNCKAMTLNSLGHRTWCEATGRHIRIESGKTYAILKQLVDECPRSDKDILYENFAELMRIIDFSKSCGYIPTGNYEKAKRLLDDDGFFNHIEQKLSDLEIGIVRMAVLISLKQSFEGLCDYNDQILMPTVFHGAFPRYPLTLIDEAQDLSALNHATLRKMIGTRRLIAVGDSNQCQPPGTKILTPSGEVNIEDIKQGDEVISLHRDKKRLRARKVLQTAQRHYQGQLIKVITERAFYQATSNHRCVARLRGDRANWHGVYLMRKGGAFRVGKAILHRVGQFGLSLRARQEQADAVWLLKAFKTKEEALAYEAIISSVYGLPDICFRNSGELAVSQERLNYCWAEIIQRVADFKERARGVLSSHGLSFQYPIWSKEDKEQISLNRQCLIRACNLQSALFEVPVVNSQDNIDWLPADIFVDYYNGVVYSLEVEGLESTNYNGLYVSNGIVTGNSIYGFRGAHEESMATLQREFNMHEMHLSISFRCPKAVVEHSHWRAPTMRWPEWAAQGEVKYLAQWGPNDLPESATIICRNNAPLFKLAIKLLTVGRPVELHGKDVVASLTKVMRKFGDSNMRAVDVLDRIDAWEEKEKSKNKNRAHGSIEDRAECMRTFASRGATLGDALAYAQHMVQMHSPLKMMTGHKAKGLEFDNVFFLDNKLIGDDEQEPNLRYVIITRAKQTLIYINSDDMVLCPDHTTIPAEHFA